MICIPTKVTDWNSNSHKCLGAYSVEQSLLFSHSSTCSLLSKYPFLFGLVCTSLSPVQMCHILDHCTNCKILKYFRILVAPKTHGSKAVPLSQFFFVRAPMISNGVCFVIICPSSFLLSLHRKTVRLDYDIF